MPAPQAAQNLVHVGDNRVVFVADFAITHSRGVLVGSERQHSHIVSAKCMHGVMVVAVTTVMAVVLRHAGMQALMIATNDFTPRT